VEGVPYIEPTHYHTLHYIILWGSGQNPMCSFPHPFNQIFPLLLYCSLRKYVETSVHTAAFQLFGDQHFFFTHLVLKLDHQVVNCVFSLA
jgi:hypothetical protein